MVEAALADFHALEIVRHANLAERFLCDGR